MCVWCVDLWWVDDGLGYGYGMGGADEDDGDEREGRKEERRKGREKGREKEEREREVNMGFINERHVGHPSSSKQASTNHAPPAPILQ